MKKLSIAVVILVVVLLLVTPWGVGGFAEKRMDTGLEQLVEAAPYLTVVERKYTKGWFKSEHVVTFEAFGGWMKALSPKAVEDDAADDAGTVEVPEEPAKPEEPLRFTVRNEVLHGPVLGLTGFGLARVNSHLVFDDKVRKELEEVFGPKAPLEVTTRLGFFGGGRTTFKSEGRTIKPKDSQTEITWETFKLAVGYSGNLDEYDVDGTWPKLEMSDKSARTQFVMTNMTMDGDGKRVRGDLYDGDFDLSVEKVTFFDDNQNEVEVSQAQYLVTSESKGEFTGMSAKLGTGEIKSKVLSAQGVEIKEAHYDLSVRRLHTETLEKVITAFKATYAKPLATTVEGDEVMFAPLKAHGMELLKYDPEFVIDRIGVATPEGDGYVMGVVKLKGATAEDFGVGSMALIGKIDADITFNVSEKMIQKFPNGSTAAGAAVDSGYAKREGERLICKIVFKNGELTVNGKPQAIPGLGGPPPGVESMEPPPQE
ncbi:MAG TPA: YdgA family protein [Steroidobacteraceae bacterium]